MPLTKEQFQRYARNIAIPKLGARGQEKLLESKALIVGLGGLGSSCAYYLAAAGIGTIGLVDFDSVELDNLQRQILYITEDIGRRKVKVAGERLSKLNPGININAYQEKISGNNILDLVGGYDLLIECSDNYLTKYMLNDAAIIANKPFFYAAVARFEGQALTVLPKQSACLRCLFPRPPAQEEVMSPKETGILGTVAGMVGLIQANEVIKYILKVGKLLTNKLLIFNSLNMEIKKIKLKPNSNCLVCGVNPTIKEIKDKKKILAFG
ncbi:MAG: HesA/MoeB/ThiF family protein [Candidatus Omnitrophota bacterium]